MSKLKLKQISSLHRRILRQMISRCRSIQALDELCNCGTVHFCGRIILQPNAKEIDASGWAAGYVLSKFDRSPGRHCRRGSRSQVARDLMNFCGRETLLFALLAAAHENHQNAANSHQRETSWF